jgi:thioredoxin-like negative regulator of GroEL
MSTVSSEATPHGPREQGSDAVPSLSLEADPSGFVERAPALASLLPDAALARALAGGDTHTVYAVLTARLEREPPGPSRDTLKQVLAQRELFTVAELAPRLGTLLGTGISFARLPAPDPEHKPFIATRSLRLLGVPIWPLSQHLVRRDRSGQLQVLGRVPTASHLTASRTVSVLAAAGVVLASLGVTLPLASREVHLVNGLSRTVLVQLDDKIITLAPGAVATERVSSLLGSPSLQARWPGESKPFEVVQLEDQARPVYNVLGAASLKVGNPAEVDTQHPLAGKLASLAPDEQLLGWNGGWERTVREAGDAGDWQRAAEVAQAVALADPTAPRARDEALRWTIRHKRVQAEEFIRRLTERYPDDLSVHRLAQDAFAAMDQRERSSQHYAAWAAQAPDSLFRALLHARSLDPDEQPQAYAQVLERFPQAPEARLEIARLHLEDGDPEQALALLEEFPSTLEGVELRVRALLSLKRLKDASNTVRHYSTEPKHLSWELAVLAGRLDRLVGPIRARYITHDLIPSEFAQSPEHMAAFALLTGDSTLNDKELKALTDPLVREALELTNKAMTRDLPGVAKQARAARDSVLNRMPMEAVAVLALELVRQGDADGATRLFGSHLALWLAREPLEEVVRTGVDPPRMALLSPNLHATAHLIRARGLKEAKAKEEEQLQARQADVIGGFARRELDPGYSEYKLPPSKRELPHRCHHREIIQIIKGNPDAKPK